MYVVRQRLRAMPVFEEVKMVSYGLTPHSHTEDRRAPADTFTCDLWLGQHLGAFPFY